MERFTHPVFVSAFALLTTAPSYAAVVADLHVDFVTTETASPAPGSNFNTNNWSLQGSDGVQLIYDNVGILGNNDPTGWHHPTANLFGFQLPAISQSDLFDGGMVPANELALHGQGTINLDIVWTADQNYESVFANYVYNRVGDNGAPNTGSSTLTILGTAGVSLAQTNVAATGSTAPSLGVLAGETVIFRITGAGGGEASGNFQIDAVIPEPSSLALIGLGSLLVARRRRNRL